jgi:hypothetical protein
MTMGITKLLQRITADDSQTPEMVERPLIVWNRKAERSNNQTVLICTGFPLHPCNPGDLRCHLGPVLSA